MKSDKNQFKYVVRRLKSKDHRLERIGNRLAGFWKSVNKMKQSKNVHALSIDR